MFFRNLTMKKGVKLKVTLAEAHMPVRLGHRNAEATFVEPLANQLAAAGLGTVNGYDAVEMQLNEVVGVDLYLGLTDASRPALETVGRMLDQLGAPLGSSIRLTEVTSEPVIFGSTEGLELAISAELTPDAESRKSVVQLCRSAIEERSISRGWINRADKTLFYFYGESFADMRDRLISALGDDPRFSQASLRRLA